MTGTIAANVPVLSALSIAINTYRLQVALAPVATNIFSAALYRLQAALYAVHAALGPIGWVILAISAAISGGMVLWNKYTQSLQKTAQTVKTASPADLAKGFRELEKSTEESTDAMEDAGKAAGKNLQSFDEIHQLQKDMAGGGGAGEDILDEFDLGGIGGGLPGLDMGDMMADIEQIKPTLKGFWEWIKQEAGNLWDSVKVKWNMFVEWVKGWDIWAWIGEKWNNFKIWAGELWSSIQTKWDNFKTNIQQKWNVFWEPIKTQWNSFKSWAGELLAPVRQKWNSFVTWAHGIWDGLLKKWNEIKSWPLWKWNGDQATWLKNIFKFEWSLPRSKVPRFYVTWATSGFWGKLGDFLGLPGKPILGVEWVNWYAEGGIFNQPSIIGVCEGGA